MKLFLMCLIALTVTGCNFVAVEVHQNSVMDKGDSTKDNYSDDDNEDKTDTLKIPLYQQ